MVSGVKAQLDMQSINQVKQNFTKLQRDLQQMANSKPIDMKINSSGINQQVASITNNFQILNNTVNNTSGSFRNFGSSTSSLIGFFSRWLAVSTLVMGSLRELKNGLNEIMDINKSDVNMAMITNTSVANIEKMNAGWLETAKKLGALNKEVMSGAESWVRSGINIDDANKNLETTIKLAKIAGVSNQEMADNLIVVKNGWDLNAKGVEDYSSKVALLDNSSATSAEKINKAMTYSTESFKANGVEMDDAMSWITNFSEKSAKSGSSIGRSFVSVMTNFHKMQDSVKDGDKNETDAVNKLEMLLAKKGVALRKSKNEWNDLGSVIKNIQRNIGKFSEIEKSDLAFKIGGKENAELTLSTINNMKRIDELNQKLKSDTGAKALTESYEKYMDSIEFKMNNLKNQATELWSKLINSKQIKAGIDDVTMLIKIIEQLATEDKGILALGVSFVVLVKVVKDLKIALAELGSMEAVLGSLASAINPVTLALVVVGTTLALVAGEHVKHKEVVNNLTESYKKLNEVMKGNTDDKSKDVTGEWRKQQTELRKLIAERNKAKAEWDKLSETGKNSMGNQDIGEKYGKASTALLKFTGNLKESGVAYNEVTGTITNLFNAEKNVASFEELKRLDEVKNKLNETYSNSTNVISFYKIVQDEINNTGKISESTYSSIIKDHKNLAPFVNDEKELYKRVSAEIEKEKGVCGDTYKKMQSYSVDYYNSIIKNSSMLVDVKKAGYSVDLKNFKSLESAKMAVAKESLKEIAGAWASFYNLQTGALDDGKVDRLIEAKMKINKLANPYQLDKTVSKVKTLNPMTGKVEIKDKITYKGRPSQDSDFRNSLIDEDASRLRELEKRTKADAQKRANLFAKFEPKFDSSKLNSIGGSGSGYNPTGSGGGGKDKTKKETQKKVEKDVENLEIKIDKYGKLENELKSVETELDRLNKLEGNATEEKKLNLKVKEIKLLDEKKLALQNIYKEQGKENQLNANALKKQGAKFDSLGNISNRTELITSKTNNANKLHGDAKKAQIESVKKFEESIKAYEDLRFNKINEVSAKIFNLEQDRLTVIKETTEIVKTKITSLLEEEKRQAELKLEIAKDTKIAKYDEELEKFKTTHNAIISGIDEQIRKTEELNRANDEKEERLKRQLELSELQNKLNNLYILQEKELKIYGNKTKEVFEESIKIKNEALQKQIDNLTKINEIEDEKEERLKRQLELIKLQNDLTNTKSQKNIRELKQGSDGSYQFEYVADKAKVENINTQVGDKTKENSNWEKDISNKNKVDAIKNQIDHNNKMVEENAKTLDLLEKQLDGSVIGILGRIDDLNTQILEKQKDNSRWEKQLLDTKNRELLEKQKKSEQDLITDKETAINADKLITENAYKSELFSLSNHYVDMDKLVVTEMDKLKVTYGNKWDEILREVNSKLGQLRAKTAEMDKLQNQIETGMSKQGGNTYNVKAYKGSKEYKQISNDFDKACENGDVNSYDRLQEKAVNLKEKYKIDTGMSTGGMTTDWNDGNTKDNGKLVNLHPNEIVNNPIDSKMLMKASELLSKVDLSGINSQLLNMKMPDIMMNIPQPNMPNFDNNSRNQNQNTPQNVVINADFPGVNSKIEIEGAFKDMFGNIGNIALQHANERK